MFAYVGGGSFQKPLTTEEETKYLSAMYGGDMTARDILIERNMRLVAHIVKKYATNQRDANELISVGSIGLIKAVNTYRAGKGSKLATYAARCVENEILMFLRNTKKYRNDLSLQESVGVDKEGNEVALEEKLAYEGESVEESVEKRDETLLLYKKLELLTPRERCIIRLRYGMATGEEVTQREIAKKLGISRSYVSRIEKKALEKLRSELSDK
jgi:RNA polymerase sporulation-specific sigma factor